MELTRQERMLSNYDIYTKQWEENNRYLSEARSTLTFSKDFAKETFYANLDSEHLKKVTMKNIFDKSFS